MNVESIQRFCLSLPQATENLQWGDDLCFKVGGKIFAMISLSSIPQRMSFKCTPESFVELVLCWALQMGLATAVGCSAVARTAGPAPAVLRDGGGEDQCQG
jgi:hypothetical protein